MPLTKSGKRIIKKFKQEYGKKAGKSNFYATMNKKPTATKKWHQKGK